MKNSPWSAVALLKLAGFRRAESRSERFLKLAAEAREHVATIAPRDVVIGRGAVIIDVREKEEFHRGHIPGALHLPRGTIELEIESRVPNPDEEFVIYCGDGNRSALATESLQRMGYRKGKVIAGGIHAWLAAGYPVWRRSQLIED